MKRSNGYGTKSMLVVAVVGTMVFGGGPVRADFALGEYTNLGPAVNSPHGDVFPRISADGLTLYFASDRPDGLGDHDLWLTTRVSKDCPWTEAVNMGATVNSPDDEYGPTISADGLALFFNSDRPGGSGENDLWVATRATVNDDWSSPANLGPAVNSPANEFLPSISPDGLSLYFVSNRPGGQGDADLYVTTRRTPWDAWGTPVNLGATVNGPSADSGPTVTGGGLSLFFMFQPHPMPRNYSSLWLSKRRTAQAPWGTPVNLGPCIDRDVVDLDISPDGTSVFLSCYKRSGGSGWQDIWQAPITPICDFNGDGVVDVVDVFIMLQHWQTDHPLCDIGPMPWGDGIVDAQDLAVLAEHL